LGSISPCLAGPRRPQDRVNLGDVPATFAREMRAFRKDDPETRERDGLRDGAVVIAAITSCTNTSNPSVMLGAGILARKARERGLTRQPWVKTSLAPGSQAVTEYLQRAGLLKSLEELGFHVVGYGCTTCIGNSGPLDGPIVESIRKNDLVAVSVLSGNRNFEGRVNADVKANFLASPPLVVAYAIAGRIDIDLTREPLGIGHDGKNVYLSDIWPSPEEIASLATQAITSEVFSSRYASAMEGDVTWRAIVSPTGSRYEWDRESTYIRCPPYFDGMKDTPPGLSDVKDARILAIVGDSVTTDHISPAGSIKSTSPAARWLKQHGVEPLDFNSYGSRRGNHEVMARGTLASLRLRNAMTPGIEGGVTRLLPEGQKVDIFDAAEVYRERGDSVVLIAGREYGSGSSRDWAAKGPALLGVRAVIAQSFERIHRSNLIGMGIVPLCFPEGQSAASFGLTGEERVSIPGLNSLIQHFQRGQTVEAEFVAPGGKVTRVPLLVRIDTAGEAESLKHGGILQRVARRIIEKTRGKGGKQ
jgi:aconitate hydratase